MVAEQVRGPHPRAAGITLAVVGAASAVFLVAVAVGTRTPEVLAPSALAAAFLLAGLVGTRARPDHVGLLHLLAVGSLHLVAFAISAGVEMASSLPAWGAWSLTLVADALYAAGFVALALVVARYPSGQARTRLQQGFTTACLALAAAATADAVLFHERVEMPLAGPEAYAPSPGPLPFPGQLLPLSALPPLLLIAAVVVLVRTAKVLPEDERRALGWATLSGGGLALMLVATPLATTLVPVAVWSAAFIGLVGAIPFLLLAGLVRYRLLQVDLYLTRTLARGGFGLVVLALYAAAAALLGRDGTAAAAAGVTVLAALTGTPVLRHAERVADRWFTGGRIARRAVMDNLEVTLASADPERLPERLATFVADSLDVAWVRIDFGELTLEHGSSAEGAAAVEVELITSGHAHGRLSCGPRRGGWATRERELLRRLAGPVALALAHAEVSRELRARVEELSAARGRLVQAEESARQALERDLHDGVQQLLVALLARLSLARAQLQTTPGSAPALVAAHELASQAIADLRELVSGLHPPLLTERGLVPAVQARVGHLPIEVEMDVDPRTATARFGAEVEGAAFFVVSEALTNTMKHAGTDRARVVIAPHGEAGLRVAVVDGGSGTTCEGSGLRGLRDRVEALDGTFRLEAVPGVGTTVLVDFPSVEAVTTDV